MRVLADIPRLHAARQPDKVAMIFEGRETTYGQLDRRANQIANGLIGESLELQSRVALLDKNTDVYYELLFGTAKANDALVAVNWRLAPPEIAYVVNDSMAEVLFVGMDFFETIEALRGDLKTVRKIIALDGSHPQWESYTSWRDAQRDTEPGVHVAGSDVALQMYTSGTTGRPKGAQLTNDNLLSTSAALPREYRPWNDNDVNLVCMPLFHIAGGGWGLTGIHAGVKSIILREVVPSAILHAIAQYRVTKVFLVPAAILFLLQSPEIRTVDLSSLDLIVYGASPIPIDLLHKAVATFKCGFMQVYGATEVTGPVTLLPPEDHDLKGNPRMRSCGKPFTTVQIRIVNTDGNDLAVGQVGEIICRSPQNMKGYWNLPEETSRSVCGEWFHTGDAGYMDEDGYLYIHDRLKDVIITGAENVYPAEVEGALFGHPAIADVAVIGVPDPQWGETVKAIVVKRPGMDVTAEEIIAYARERIAGYKAPKSVDFVDALPRNPSGKVLKREIRKRYWTDHDRQVN